MQISPEVVKSEVQMVLVLKSILSDLTSLKTAANALRADHNTLIAKLNLDGGVTDTDYAASTASDVTLSTS